MSSWVGCHVTRLTCLIDLIRRSSRSFSPCLKLTTGVEVPPLTLRTMLLVCVVVGCGWKSEEEASVGVKWAG